MDYRKPDPKVIKLWRLRKLKRLVFYTALFFAAKSILSALNVDAGYFKVPLIVLFGSIEVFLIISLIVSPAIEYRQWQYLITEERIEIRHGIFFISTTVIPVLRIQHVTIEQWPLDRLFRLARVEISTAGGRFAIEGLTEKDADMIAVYLKDRIHARLKNEGAILQ